MIARTSRDAGGSSETASVESGTLTRSESEGSFADRAPSLALQVFRSRDLLARKEDFDFPLGQLPGRRRHGRGSSAGWR